MLFGFQEFYNFYKLPIGSVWIERKSRPEKYSLDVDIKMIKVYHKMQYKYPVGIVLFSGNWFTLIKTLTKQQQKRN